LKRIRDIVKNVSRIFFSGARKALKVAERMLKKVAERGGGGIVIKYVN
jgi:hypothetical protein